MAQDFDRVSIVVPPSATPGTVLEQIMPDGQELSLRVPEGVYPGSVLTLVWDPTTGSWSCTADPAPVSPQESSAVDSPVPVFDASQASPQNHTGAFRHGVDAAAAGGQDLRSRRVRVAPLLRPLCVGCVGGGLRLMSSKFSRKAGRREGRSSSESSRGLFMGGPVSTAPSPIRPRKYRRSAARPPQLAVGHQDLDFQMPHTKLCKFDHISQNSDGVACTT